MSSHWYDGLDTEHIVTIYGNASMVFIDGISIIRVKSFSGFTPSNFFMRDGNLIEVPEQLPSSVTSTNKMFRECHQFNQKLNWDMTNVNDTSYMFQDCTRYNQPVNFNLPRCTDTFYMFHGCQSLDKPVTLYTPMVTNMSCMFLSMS